MDPVTAAAHAMKHDLLTAMPWAQRPARLPR